MKPGFQIVPLTAAHERSSFSCGVEALDRYLQTQASQDARRRIANCFVAAPFGTTTIAGYYTIAASSIPIGDIADAKRLPRYPLVPAVLVGRLAVDRRFAGKSLGAALLADAIHRSATAEPAVFAIVVDAKDERAAGFYRHLGFVPLASRALGFYLPLATALKAASTS